jgi:hypothetical protein
MTGAQRFEALRSCVSQAVAAGCEPDDLLSLIFMVVAGSAELSDGLVEYLRTHQERPPVAAATIGLVLNFVAMQSAAVTAAVLEAATAEIEHSRMEGGAEP